MFCWRRINVRLRALFHEHINDRLLQKRKLAIAESTSYRWARGIRCWSIGSSTVAAFNTAGFAVVY